MRKLSSLLGMAQMDSLKFEITSCIHKNFIHSSNHYVTPQRIPWQYVASVSYQGICNVTANSSNLGDSQADIGSPEYKKYSANYGGPISIIYLGIAN